MMPRHPSSHSGSAKRVLTVATRALIVLAGSSLALTASPTDKPQGFGSATTGGAGGTVVTVDNIADLKKYASASGKHIIYIKGTMGDAGSKTSKGGDRITPTADKTFLGLPGATIKGGFDIKVSNIIIRNLAVWGPGANDIDGNDPIHIEGTGAKNIWIDHCLVSDGQDGNLDITNAATNVSVTWNKFSYTSLSSNHQYCNLIGSSATKTADTVIKVTMAWNWWADGVVERMPRVRFGKVHVINNLVKTNTSNYAVRAGQNANILVEKNAFIKTKNPIEIFKDETGQMVKVTADNYFEATSGTQAGISAEKVFAAPYTLTGLIDAKTLDAKVSDAADGAGPTIDAWSTSSISSHSGVVGFSMARQGSLWTLNNSTTATLQVEVLSLDGKRLQSLRIASGSQAQLPADRASRIARVTGADEQRIVPIPGF
ncbi:MAG: hypothetical protein RL173_2615 [Fibrobacterota bacterium]